MNKSNIRIRMIFFLTFFTLLSSCTVSKQQLTPPASTIGSPLNEEVILTSTPLVETPPPALTKKPTLLAPLEITPIMTQTIESEETFDLESIQTPQGEGRRQQVLWLYETNNGCQLPCWWGITPGDTSWTITHSFLRGDVQLVVQASPTRNDNLEGYEVQVPLLPDIFQAEETKLFILVKDGVVKQINTQVAMGDTPDGYFAQYELTTFLNTYGRPSEIWLSTSPSPFENNELPFRVVLYYRERGIAALFTVNAVKQGDIVVGCLQKAIVSALSLWSPSESRPFAEVKDSYAVFNVDFLSLEESTNININTFYEIFQTSENTTCLETSAGLWR